jgi:hypothetical protein
MFLVTCKASTSQVHDNIMIMKAKSRLLSLFLTSNEPNLESRNFCFACGETIQVYPLHCIHIKWRSFQAAFIEAYQCLLPCKQDFQRICARRIVDSPS